MSIKFSASLSSACTPAAEQTKKEVEILETSLLEAQNELRRRVMHREELINDLVLMNTQDHLRGENKWEHIFAALLCAPRTLLFFLCDKKENAFARTLIKHKLVHTDASTAQTEELARGIARARAKCQALRMRIRRVSQE